MSGSLPIEQVRGLRPAHTENHHDRTGRTPKLDGIAVVGLGYWGPNWIRNLHQLRCARRLIACDLDAARCEHIEALYPGVATTASFEELLNDSGLDAMVIATPVSTHYRLARMALEAGKSVLVEKPLAMSCRESADLVRLSREQGRTLMVGHTFLYSAPVLKIHELIEAGELGDVLYISSTRANLGLFQHDVNVAWDLAAHDISIILMLMGRLPDSVSCQGQSHYGQAVENVALLTMHFPNNVIAFVHVSWLDPNKIRRTTIVGSRKMLVYDDTMPQEKIRVYDRGVNVHRYYDTYGEFHFSYRYGDIQIPRIEESEPLRVECQHFVDCISDGTTPHTDGLDGLRVVSVLEAANLSLRENGRTVPVDRTAV